MENVKDVLKDPRCSIFPFGGDVRDLDILDKAVERNGLRFSPGRYVVASLQRFSPHSI